MTTILWISLVLNAVGISVSVTVLLSVLKIVRRNRKDIEILTKDIRLMEKENLDPSITTNQYGEDRQTRIKV